MRHGSSSGHAYALEHVRRAIGPWTPEIRVNGGVRDGLSWLALGEGDDGYAGRIIRSAGLVEREMGNTT